MTEQRTTSTNIAPSPQGAAPSAGGPVAERASESATNPQASGVAASEGRATGRRQSDRIIAASESGQRSLDQATACARGESAVLIAGPSGCGRKHFGRAIHAWSRRSAERVVVFPVASTPDGLQERELFGSADGSAIQGEDSAGALASAGRGTLLIDRLDLLQSGVRSSLIHAMQTGSFRRGGLGDPVAVNARIIATVGSGSDSSLLGDLPTEVVSLEGLCDRREDILPLAAHFLAEVAEDEEIRPIGFTSDARHWLVEEEFSGNVRELRERIRQSVRLSSDGVISAESLMLATDGDEVPSFKDAKRAFETRYVEGLLRRCSGNISRAARLAKKDRKDFYDVIRRTGVDPSEFRT
ncbi:MAG: sigma-54-dependent Fis family transcriptional regulator [bacterium]|nr:sigma-54-dependent Fis family transcriptional regulator [bacterium]